jgi:hypothetical protein
MQRIIASYQNQRASAGGQSDYQAVPAYGIAQSKVGLAELKKSLHVKHQGTCALSWAFAVVALVEQALWNKNGKVVNFSEQELLDCCSQENAPE